MNDLRTELRALIAEYDTHGGNDDLEQILDRAIALIHAADGSELGRINQYLLARIRDLEEERLKQILLTRAEADLAADALRQAAYRGRRHGYYRTIRDNLADRITAA